MASWSFRDRTIGRPAVMGILNVTPDSFSDGGRSFEVEAAVAHALRLIEDGADLLDVGGESTRPGATPVSADEEIRRVVPVIEALRGRIAVPISIDTMKAEVARAALAAGAEVVNDVGGATLDPAMIDVVAEAGAGLVIMHMRGTPTTMQQDPRYADVVAEVLDFLAAAVERAERAGIARHRIAVDPGIGFGKRTEHNVALLRGIPRLSELGCAVLIGTSRKGLLGKWTGRETGDRRVASVASALAALAAGADVVRVHDVAETVDAIKVWSVQKGWDEA